MANSDVAVIKISRTAGMLPLWEELRWYPSVALYADGRLITEGAQVELYPGPALPSLVVTRFSQNGVDQALEWAAQAGLVGEERWLGPDLLDSGSTNFTVVYADGTVHKTWVSDMSANDLEIGALRQFSDVMSSLRQWLPDEIAGDESAYAWDRLRVISFPSDPGALPDPNLVKVVDWPLSSPATRGDTWGEPDNYRCWGLSGEELATVRPLFAQAHELTLFMSEGINYQFYLHPLLPDDVACPGWE